MYDWIKIKNEYINTDISQQKLADKYGISQSTLVKRANREKWKSEKDTERKKIVTKLQEKTAEKIVATESDRIAKVMNLADVALIQLEIALQELKNDKGKIDTYKFRQLVQSIKDLKEISKSDPRDTVTEIEDDGFIDALNTKATDLDWSDDK